MTDDSIRIPWPLGRITIGIGNEQIARSTALDALDLGRVPSAGWVAARVAEYGLIWGGFNEAVWHQRIWWLASHMKPSRAPSDDEVVAARVRHSFGTGSLQYPRQWWKAILEDTDAMTG